MEIIFAPPRDGDAQDESYRIDKVEEDDEDDKADIFFLFFFILKNQKSPLPIRIINFKFFSNKFLHFTSNLKFSKPTQYISVLFLHLI